MHVMPQDNPAENEGNEISMPKLRRDNDLAMSEMQKIRKNIQMPKMWISRSLGTFVGLFIFVFKYAAVICVS